MRYLTLLTCLLFVFSCKQNKVDTYPKLDLLEYGIPIAIKAPEGATVEKTQSLLMKDVSVQSGDNYYVQIYASDASTIDKSKILADQKSMVKSGPFFSKIIEEKEEGFIFEKKIDENNINYDFRVVKVQGDKEYIFQTGLIGKFTEQDVREMYQSVL